MRQPKRSPAKSKAFGRRCVPGAHEAETAHGIPAIGAGPRLDRHGFAIQEDPRAVGRDFCISARVNKLVFRCA